MIANADLFDMSECNYCTYQRLLKNMPKTHKITKLKSISVMGGVEIYIHPKEIDINNLTDKESKQYLATWFMALPERCVC